jgi:hypothetical protein
MLLVATYLAQSEIHELGLFAAETIRAGTTIWEFAPGFDLELSEEELGRLAEPCRQRILSYAYFNARKLRYILCSDDARFMNHSEHPNTLCVGFGADDACEGQTIAARDIAAGEELTEDYWAFEEASRNLQHGIVRVAPQG